MVKYVSAPVCISLGDYVSGLNFIGRVVGRSKEGYTLEVFKGYSEGKRNTKPIPRDIFTKNYKKIYDTRILELLYE